MPFYEGSSGCERNIVQVVDCEAHFEFGLYSSVCAQEFWSAHSLVAI